MDDVGVHAALAATIEPLPELEDADFGVAFERWANRRVVLLGEATHGTAEFYRARAVITRHLIEHHGFNIVAVEADWPDAAAIDRYVRQRPPVAAPGPAFQRFPTWMWRNTEVAAFTRWLREHNASKGDPASRAGFYGLDVYNLHASIAGVLQYLDREDPAAARLARERYGCLTPWQDDPATYGRAALTEGFRKCEAAVVAQCRDLLQRQLADGSSDAAAADNLLDATQNARLVAAAERYYRVMYYGGAESWNLRDTHMFDTLEQVLDARGPHSRAVVWAHNSHIGDARQTDMGISRGELNLGQLCRERFGDACALIGFGTHTGTVAAADDWDGEMQVMQVRPSLPDSIERLCHDAGPRFLLDLQRNAALARRLGEPRKERFIGVIYRPRSERYSHYAEVRFARQFDGWVWFDETRAVTPLRGARESAAEPPELWPFGL